MNEQPDVPNENNIDLTIIQHPVRCCPFCNKTPVHEVNRKFKCYGCNKDFLEPKLRESAQHENNKIVKNKKRPADDQFDNIPTLKQLHEIIDSTFINKKYNALFRCCAMTGSRISEVLKLMPSQVSIRKPYANDDTEFLIFENIPVLKHRKKDVRTVEFPVCDFSTKFCIWLIERKKDAPNRPIFDMGYDNALLISKRLRWENHHIYPHLCRHIKVTEQITKGFTLSELQKEYKWKSEVMPLYYKFNQKKLRRQKTKNLWNNEEETLEVKNNG